MRRILSLLALLIIAWGMSSCGDSIREKKELQRQQQVADSLALKVATLPTLDCLPIFVAYQNDFFKSQGVDVKLMEYEAQIDCDRALTKKHVECAVSDIFRAERMRKDDSGIKFITSTSAYWQLIANQKARVKEIRQLSEKMIGMARYSATDYLTNVALDSVRPDNQVFRIQVNDVIVRLGMLLNNSMDAVFLTEPQATTARLAGHRVLMDSRNKGLSMGAIISRGGINDQHRQKQIEGFTKAYNMACDSINRYGMQHYADVINRYCHADDATVKALPKIVFEHATQPKASDLEKTKNVKWRLN